MKAFHNIVIVGIGLIGGSLAGAYREAFPNAQVMGVDPDAASLDTALARGWLTCACAPDDASLEAYVREGCDLVVLAVPAQFSGDYFRKLQDWGYAGLITDTCSTKGRICSIADATLKNPGQFLPGHPMAGSEVNGIEGARSDLFEGMHWILCPDARTPGEWYTRLHDTLTALSARVVSLPREEHDRAVAVISHVPHFTAASLVELAVRHADKRDVLFRLAAGGFKDSTRIAAGSPALWCGIAFDNREAIVDGLAELRGIIGQFQTALEEGDRDRLRALLDSSSQARRSIPAKWLPSTDNMLEVRIPMENRSGVVAEVTAIASKAGCNINSIEIDHVTAHTAVLSMILTDEGDFGRLSTDLLDKGFKVSLAPLSAKE
ncbi:prephenate dehydrogenase [Hugonella massiliensis]|uniref:prephenate dehydrogenase n=1 Tax=Hugonella massiliensis TaxID=1720315 RepID=UPI00073E8B44|nr:prephenate dehydrogenase/arogenate dehydrogenase family protein [Hugonella massiliensis]